MNRPARILPLAAVAVGGVLAFKALDAVGGVGALFPSAAAHAEEAHAAKGKTAPPVAPGASPTTAAPAGGPARPSAPACALGPAELAREAGLSPAELTLIQSLSARRGQLDAREQALDAQLQLLAAAETKVDAKLRALDAGKTQLQALLGQADAQGQAEVDRLVTVYEKMKPSDAGALMAQLDDRVRVPVAAKMKPAILAAVLPKMGGPEAKHLTETLARRFAAVREQVAAAQAGAAATPVVTPADAKAGAGPFQPAQASPAPADKAASASPEKPAAKAAAAPKRAVAPKRLARAAPRRPAVAKPAATGDTTVKVPTAATAAATPSAKPATAAAASPARPADKPAP